MNAWYARREASTNPDVRQHNYMPAAVSMERSIAEKPVAGRRNLNQHSGFAQATRFEAGRGAPV